MEVFIGLPKNIVMKYINDAFCGPSISGVGADNFFFKKVEKCKQYVMKPWTLWTFKNLPFRLDNQEVREMGTKNTNSNPWQQ